MRKSNIIIKKVRNLMILSMAVIVIISVYFNILNSRAKETTDIVANVTDETGEVDQPKINKGWFIPSKEEWSAFGEELGITKSNYSYSANGLSDGYWSSSQSNAVTRSAWYANFKHGAMYYGYNNSYVRLATTF